MDSAILNLDKNQDKLRVFHLISRFKESIFLSILRTPLFGKVPY